MYKLIKPLLFIFTVVFLAGFSNVNANSLPPIDEAFCDFTPVTPNDIPPDPQQIICPLLRIYNASILIVGVVLIGIIAIGGIKLAMSLGDPKGYQMATKTWTYALWGLAVVLGSFFILRILDYTLGLGLNFLSPKGLFEAFSTALRDLLDFGFIIQT